MSHLSRIKTCINNKEILEKTLLDLNFKYKYSTTSNKEYNYKAHTKDIIVQEYGKNLFIFSWNGEEYSLLADLQLWNLNIPYTKLLERITQQYSYNTIIQESTRYGFTNINEKLLQDGSIQLVIQRWH